MLRVISILFTILLYFKFSCDENGILLHCINHLQSFKTFLYKFINNVQNKRIFILKLLAVLVSFGNILSYAKYSTECSGTALSVFPSGLGPSESLSGRTALFPQNRCHSTERTHGQ